MRPAADRPVLRIPAAAAELLEAEEGRNDEICTVVRACCGAGLRVSLERSGYGRPSHSVPEDCLMSLTGHEGDLCGRRNQPSSVQDPSAPVHDPTLEPGESSDPATDRLFLLASPGSGEYPSPALNGELEPGSMEFVAGSTYRLRFMHISPDDGRSTQLRAGNEPAEWRFIAPWTEPTCRRYEWRRVLRTFHGSTSGRRATSSGRRRGRPTWRSGS